MSNKPKETEAEEEAGAAPIGEETAETAEDADEKSPDANGDEAAAQAAAESGGHAEEPEESKDAGAAADSAAARIAELEAQVQRLREQHLRALAEAENIRKRGEREREDLRRYGGIPLARSILGVHDSFDRLLAMMDDEFRKDAVQFAEGVDLIHRELLNAFEKHEIRVIEAEKGAAFDPHQHQAMFKEIDEDVKSGDIVRVFEKGFLLGERLLRPATVSVADEVVAAKAEPEAAAAKEDGEESPEGSEAESKADS